MKKWRNRSVWFQKRGVTTFPNLSKVDEFHQWNCQLIRIWWNRGLRGYDLLLETEKGFEWTQAKLQSSSSVFEWMLAVFQKAHSASCPFDRIVNHSSILLDSKDLHTHVYRCLHQVLLNRKQLHLVDWGAQLTWYSNPDHSTKTLILGLYHFQLFYLWILNFAWDNLPDISCSLAAQTFDPEARWMARICPFGFIPSSR